MDDRMTDGSRVSYDHAFVGSSYVGIGCEYCGEQRQTHLKHVADYDQLRADKAALEAQLAQSEARLNSCLEEADVRCKGSIDTCPHCRYLREKLASWPHQYDQQVADCTEHRRKADEQIAAAREERDRAVADNAALQDYAGHKFDCTILGGPKRYGWMCDCGWNEVPDDHPGAALLEEMDWLRARNEKLEAEKNGAYSERNALVAALSKLLPTSLERHVGEEWEVRS